MFIHLRECKIIFEEYVSTPVLSPPTKIVFEVREDAENLSNKKGYLFHSVMAKLLFIMKRYRPDLETAVVFLMIRVSKTDVVIG